MFEALLQDDDAEAVQLGKTLRSGPQTLAPLEAPALFAALEAFDFSKALRLLQAPCATGKGICPPPEVAPAPDPATPLPVGRFKSTHALILARLTPARFRRLIVFSRAASAAPIFVAWSETTMSNPLVLMETTAGDVLLELFSDKAPATVENFLHRVDEGFYSNTIFHRVIKDFMIQGGGLTLRMEEKPAGPAVRNEAGNGLKNLRGTLAMARTLNPHSAAAQFFINTVDNPELDHTAETTEGYGYCVFGQVTDGMDVVDKIEKLKVKAVGEHEAVPVDSVLITGMGRFE